MEYTEKRLDGETKYSGVIVDVTLDNVELHDGTIEAVCNDGIMEFRIVLPV